MPLDLLAPTQAAPAVLSDPVGNALLCASRARIKAHKMTMPAMAIRRDGDICVLARCGDNFATIMTNPKFALLNDKGEVITYWLSGIDNAVAALATAGWGGAEVLAADPHHEGQAQRLRTRLSMVAPSARPQIGNEEDPGWLSSSLTRLQNVLADPASDAIVRAQSAKLEGGPEIIVLATARLGDALRLLVRLSNPLGPGYASKMINGVRSSTNRYAVFDDQGHMLHAAPLVGFNDVARFLIEDGWVDAQLKASEEPGISSAKNIRNRIRRIVAGQ